MSHSHNPVEQISSGNAWYIDDQFAKQYNRPGARSVILNRWRVLESAIADFLREKNLSTVKMLDAGCGDGINLFGLSNMIEQNKWPINLFGTDYNPLRVDRAAKLANVKEIVQSSLNKLPYGDGEFDIVLCNHVLEHISEDKQALTELKRILRPGGMLILGVPNEGCLLAQLRNNFFQRSIKRTTDHVNFYTRESLMKLLVVVGFKPFKVERAGFFLPHFTLQFIITATFIGRTLINGLGKIWPSQSSDLIIISRK